MTKGRKKMKRGHNLHGTRNGFDRILDDGGMRAGTVLTLENDIPLDPSSTIDLERLSKDFDDGVPKFKTRQADPMRPFTRHTREQVLDHVLKNESASYIPDAMRPHERNQLLSGLPLSDDTLKRLLVKEGRAAQKGYAEGYAVGQLPFSEEFMNAVPGMLKRMTPDTKKRFFDAVNSGNHKAALEVAKEVLPALEGDVVRTTSKLHTVQAERDVLEMAHAPKLQRLGETAFHKLIEAFKRHEVLFPISENRGLQVKFATEEGWAQITTADIFVVQHDWASAFRHAEGFSEGDFRLPYHGSVFEFSISGRRLILSIEAHDTEATFRSSIMFVETSAGWAMVFSKDTESERGYYGDKLLMGLHEFCMEQVRAVCISLEAEVAISEVIRAPHRLNRKRERAGKMPIFDHHVVNLANRKRHAPRPAEPGDIVDEPHRKRLHWVRAHWAHYTNHKVWRRWHLRGDPDLGFVDKEYRL